MFVKECNMLVCKHKNHSPEKNVGSILFCVFERPGARFSKVPIINGPGKLSPFTLKIEVSIVLRLT